MNFWMQWWKNQSALAGFSNTALLWLELHSGLSEQMRRASSDHWRSAAPWVKNMVGRSSVSTILRCAGVHFRQAGFTFVKILLMLNCMWKSYVIWLDVRGNPFQTMCMLHYAANLRGTQQYWFKQRSRLIANWVQNSGTEGVWQNDHHHTWEGVCSNCR